MYSDQVFLLLSAAAALAEMAAVCWVWERKMRRFAEAERRAEEKRQQRSHDDFCTQEAARLYRERGMRQ